MFLSSFANALGMVFDPGIFLLILIGSLIGTTGGALPGVTTTLAVGVSVPFTFAMGPEAAVAFLVAITVGVNYGNSIPAVLVGMPGTPAAVLTALDGYKMHLRGESGLALAIQYVAAVFGQLVSAVFFVALVIPLAQLLYVFLSPELWALHLLGMTAVISLAGKNIIKGVLAVCLGLAVTFIGPDPVAVAGRFTFGTLSLRPGLPVVPVVLGALAVGELLRSCRQAFDWTDESSDRTVVIKFPKFSQLKQTIRPIGIGAVLGTLIGAIPGIGGTVSSFVSYQQTKMWSKHPEEFGEGSVEGLAANESAQSASQSGEMVPTFGFGIPGSGSMVLLLAAVSVHGLIPGPLMIQQTPQLLWAGTAGLLGGVLVIAIIGWPLAKIMLRIVSIDRQVVLAVALLLTAVGVFAIRNAVLDVVLLFVFGFLGYFMLRYGYSTAAFSLAVILGRPFEGYFRRGILLTEGSLLQFVSRPITGVMIVVSLLLLAYGVRSTLQEQRRIREAREAAGVE